MQQSTASPTITQSYLFPKHRLKRVMQDPVKEPLVIVACGSFSPVTYLHLRMFEMAHDYILDSDRFEALGGYFSPVSDGYAKPGLAHWQHRVSMCELAASDSSWLMVDPWEPSQPKYIRTALVLDHFEQELNSGADGGVLMSDGSRRRIRIMLLAGGDLIQSFAVPNLWKETDLSHILGDFGCLIIERTGANVYDFLLTNDALHAHRKNVFVVKQYIHNDISSTKIRLFVCRGMSIKYLVPDLVIAYIQAQSLYNEASTRKT
ncbi:nicotinate (nicotinamide) nucleotide adenylyltransferase [Batrachochytrium dendrobatidis JEL423]|nr:nicotinate (nicotinamide) nucleotide adenylyltransferase [Batrachochytrium dendrobatidis JEL423]